MGVGSGELSGVVRHGTTVLDGHVLGTAKKKARIDGKQQDDGDDDGDDDTAAQRYTAGTRPKRAW